MAIGPKMWPSMPLRVNSGTKPAMMIAAEKKMRAIHLGGRIGDHRELAAEVHGRADAMQQTRRRREALRRSAEMPEDVLHHDDGGIDDQPEIDRADRQQIGRFAAHHHQR